MLLRRLDLRGFTGDRPALRDALPRPADEQERSSGAVAAIIAEVRSEGDDALRSLTERFDRVTVDDLRVPAAEIDAAAAASRPPSSRRSRSPTVGSATTTPTRPGRACPTTTSPTASR